MQRRDLPKFLIGAAAGMPSVPTDPTKACFDAKRAGCALDGVTDDYAAFRRCLDTIGTSYAELVIAGPMKIGTSTSISSNVMLRFVGAGRLQPAANVTIVVEGDISVGAYLPPWELSALGSNVITSVTKVLGATEGVSSTSYVSAQMHGLVVPANNLKNQRYWTANFTLEVPPNARVKDLNEIQDHVSVSGHSLTASTHSHIWGVVGAAISNAHATSNGDVGTCLGGEFDVNNNTGYDVDNLNSDGDIGGVMVASGGRNTAMFGICMSKLSSAKGFFAGWLVRENCIDPNGFIGYFGGIRPSYGFNFGTDYAGGACMISPVHITALEMRTTSGNNARMLSVGTTLQMNGGSGGVVWTNSANTEVSATLSDIGQFQAFALAHKQQIKKPNAPAIDSSLGGQVICVDTIATTISSIIAPNMIGQQLTIIARTGHTTISAGAAKLNGDNDFAMPRYGTLRLEWDGDYWFETGRKS